MNKNSNITVIGQISGYYILWIFQKALSYFPISVLQSGGNLLGLKSEVDAEVA